MFEKLFGKKQHTVPLETFSKVASEGLSLVFQDQVAHLLEHADIQALPENKARMVQQNAVDFLEGALEVLIQDKDAFGDLDDRSLKTKAGGMLAHSARNRTILAGTIHVAIADDLVSVITTDDTHQSLLSR